MVVGLLVGALYAWRIRRSVRSAAGSSGAVAVVLLALIATSVGAAPFIGWRIVEDIRYTSSIDPWLAPRYGVSVFKVHPEIFDNAARRIPPGETYYLAPSRKLDYVTQAAFRAWALGYMLPRIAVDDPAAAKWILTLGVDPADVGPPIARTWRLKESVSGLPPAYLGTGRSLMLVNVLRAPPLQRPLLRRRRRHRPPARRLADGARSRSRARRVVSRGGRRDRGSRSSSSSSSAPRSSRWLVVGVCAALGLSGLAARWAVDRPAHGARLPGYLVPLVVILVATVALMAVDLWFQPLGVWDAWAQWTAKARSLVLFRGLDGEVFSSAAYRVWNPDYPILLPSIEASDFLFMRHVDTRAIHLQFFLLYAGFLLALIQLLRGSVREVLVWPFVLAVALCPAVQIETSASIADVPVAIFFALAGLFSWRWLLDGERLSLGLFSLFAAGTLATKFEGRIYVGALAATLILLVLVTARPRLAATLVGVAAAGAAGSAPVVALDVPTRGRGQLLDLGRGPGRSRSHLRGRTDPGHRRRAGAHDVQPDALAARHVRDRGFDRHRVGRDPGTRRCLARDRHGRARGGRARARLLGDATRLPRPPEPLGAPRRHRPDSLLARSHAAPARIGPAVQTRRRRPRTVPSASVTAVLFTCAGQRVDIVTAFRRAGATAIAADADRLAPALYHADEMALVPRVDDPGYVRRPRRSRRRA